ncbi:hypothetical protein DXG01_002094 [Tephrocybe rancida]|nr:hypothetical protein DXG01_002094 [Tephrocybe rancida]
MASSSLSSVVSNLVRASMGTSVTSQVTDDDLDRHVAELILKEAKKKAERYGAQGIRAFLPSNGLSDSNAPKTNKRFLSTIIKTTEDHNKTVLRAQAAAAQEQKREREEQERRERRARAEEAAEAERIRRSGRHSSRRSKREESWDRWDGRTADRKRKLRGWETWDEDEEENDRNRRKRRHRSRSKEKKNEKDSSRSSGRHSGRKRDRDASRSRSPQREEKRSDRHSRRRRHRNRSSDTVDNDPKKKSRRRSRSRSPRPKKAPKYALDDLESDTSPPPRHRSRPSPPVQLPSKMDKYFEESYDPRLDVAPLTAPHVPATGLINNAAFEGWDAMLELIRVRREDKEEKKRMERLGITKEKTKEKKSGDAIGSSGAAERWGAEGVSIMEIEYKKRGSVREWDLGKEGF